MNACRVGSAVSGLLLAALAGSAAAQGFGSVSGGAPPAPVVAPAPDAARCARAGSNPFLTGSAATAACADAGSFRSGAYFVPTPAPTPASVAVAEEGSPSGTDVAKAPATVDANDPGPAPEAEVAPANMAADVGADTTAATPGAPNADANPFLAGSAAKLAMLERPGTTQPFGGTHEEAVAAQTTAIEPADRVVVEKSERRLYLLRGDHVIAEYPIHLGLNPNGPKRREGDFRTPEGSYRLVRRNPRSDFFLSLEISYPNADDLERARSQGVQPGGLIMIHGQPNQPRKAAAYYANNDWTDGCIAVSNNAMVDIWLRTDVGTPIEIHP
jgi:hypothetical protein